MIDQFILGIRKASESSLQMQQDMLRYWAQHLSSPSLGTSGAPSEWSPTAAQKRSIDLMIEGLNRHRESLESTYRSGIELIEQTLRVSEAKSPEDWRRLIEDLGRKVFASFKEQSELQLRELQKWAEKMFEAPKTAGNQS
jgi:hypothetical protein